MRLSPRERDCIAVIGLSADRTVTSLAASLGIAVHQLHYILNKLTEAGSLRKVWIIDTFRLGYLRYNIFFSFRSGDQKKRQKLIRDLADNERVVFFSEVGGDVDFELSVLVKTPAEMGQFLTGLHDSYGTLLVIKAVSTRLSMIHFPRKYLSSKKSLLESITVGDQCGVVEIDTLDREILTILSTSPGYSRREVAQKLGRPETSVDLRIKKLVSSGVIRGAIWSTNSATYGAQSFKLLIRSSGLSASRKLSLLSFAAAHPNITSLIDGFGRWDIEIVAEVDNYSHLIALREKIYHLFSDTILEIKLLNRFTVHKYRNFACPIP